MKPVNKNVSKKIALNEAYHNKYIRNMSYTTNVDQSAYLKYFDEVSEKWIDDIETSNPDIIVETRTLDPKDKNKRGSRSSRNSFLADSGAQVSMVNHSLV